MLEISRESSPENRGVSRFRPVIPRGRDGILWDEQVRRRRSVVIDDEQVTLLDLVLDRLCVWQQPVEAPAERLARASRRRRPGGPSPGRIRSSRRRRGARRRPADPEGPGTGRAARDDGPRRGCLERLDHAAPREDRQDGPRSVPESHPRRLRERARPREGRRRRRVPEGAAQPPGRS